MFVIIFFFSNQFLIRIFSFLQTGRVFVLARAKRERVVQDGVEKANRRPTDPTDTPRSLFEIKPFDFWRNSLFENEQFSTKIGEIGAHSLFEN